MGRRRTRRTPRSSRPSASVSWLVNACRAQWTCERRILPRVSLIFLRRNWRPASRSTRGCADYASTMWLTPHVRLTSPPGGGRIRWLSIRSRRRARFVRVRHRPRPPSPLSRASRCAKHEHRCRGGGAGVGEQQVAVRSLAQERHQPHVPERRQAASTWSTARPPSSHAVRANAQSERPRSRTDRRPRGSNVVTFDRAQIMCEP